LGERSINSERRIAMKNPHKLFACVIRQYGTGLYRACVSLSENNVIHLGTHQNEAGAYETMNRFLEAEQNGEMKTAEDVAAFINSICTNKTPPLLEEKQKEEMKTEEDAVVLIDSIC